MTANQGKASENQTPRPEQVPAEQSTSSTFTNSSASRGDNSVSRGARPRYIGERQHMNVPYVMKYFSMATPEIGGVFGPTQ